MVQDHRGFRTISDPITLSIGAKVYREIDIILDYSTVRAQGKPTDVHRGVFDGFSFPVYSADNEEIFYHIGVPEDWDGVSDLTVMFHAYLDTADTDKKFQLRLQWENYTSGTDVVPATDNDVDVETNVTGVVAQYQSFDIDFTIDYDIDGGGNEIVAGDCLGLLLRRIAASADEIAGEVVVTEAHLKYIADKLGETV